MSKRRASERGAGEHSARPSKILCPGVSGSNAKRAGPFILGKDVGLGWGGERFCSPCLLGWETLGPVFV